MLSKEHIIFSFLLYFPLILILLLLKINPLYFTLFLIGMLLGSLIPDVDEENSYVYKLVNNIQKKIIYLKERRKEKFEEEKEKLSLYLLIASILYLYALFVKYFIYKPLAKITKEEHRGITHSIWFPIIYSFLLSLILFLLKIDLKLIFWFIFGNILGIFSHILGDSLTKSGIRPFYFGPRIKGKYLTGKDSDVPIKVMILILLLTIILKVFFGVPWIFYYIFLFLYFIYVWVSSGG